MTDDKLPNLMKTKDVAEYLVVTERTVYRMVNDGVLTAYRVGGSKRFKREDVEALPERIDVGRDKERQ